MSIRHDRDPVPAAEAVAELLADSDAADRYLDRILRAELRGYLRGRDDGYTAGYLAAIADIKAAEHELVRALTLPRDRWSVRGQQRDRATFAQPHKHDFPGTGAA